MTENNNEKTYSIYSIENQPRASIQDSTGLYQFPHLQMPLFTEQGEINTLIPNEFMNTIINGDCEQVLKAIPDNSIDLIFTSPPYADQRSATYGGIKPDQYVAWFMPKAKEFYRILKPEGSFVLNIKERVVNGERHTYVLELILEMRKRGWLWTRREVNIDIPTLGSPALPAFLVVAFAAGSGVTQCSAPCRGRPFQGDAW